MGKWLWGFMVILGTFSSVCTAFVYEFKVLRRFDTQRNRYCYFIGLSDFHDKSHEATNDQLGAIDAILEIADCATTKILLEDLSSHGSGGRNSCGAFMVNSRGGILGGLATRCRTKGFDVENVEYRYCRVCALGPVLNNIEEPPAKFASVSATPIKALAQEIDAIVDEIAAYDDGSQMCQVYQQGLEAVRPQLCRLKKEKSTLTVADFVQKRSDRDNRLEFLKDLLTFDSVLIDAKMVHAVLHASDYPRVLAFAGGAHINRVSETLAKVGYEVVYESPVSYKNEYDLKKCVGSTVIDGTYCIRPEPINIDDIKRYL